MIKKKADAVADDGEVVPAIADDVTFDAERFYSVRLARPIKVGRTMVRPSFETVRLRGDIAEANRADLMEATLDPEAA